MDGTAQFFSANDYDKTTFIRVSTMFNSNLLTKLQLNTPEPRNSVWQNSAKLRISTHFSNDQLFIK